ncbi:alpha-amylase family glycosyl hydrolase [Actinokineospora sp. NBRC 105648]|uniref:alpha-amylase family glycosyl hydrolase n=1 Tax=Actinokineospora sp. NBRC 105648 TaxID=3032206 RepID=UPI0024A5DB71|nr:alpha-amylase family glycosyl hydrolase [Actinokineospora sp. NBRC 105648]GLZ43191.1 hypothetical protein Acsp05_68150 [Actinokineospora sp. NBRC 105648]
MGRGMRALVALGLVVPLLAVPEAVAAAGGRLAVGEVVDVAPGVRPGDRFLGRDVVRAGLSGERFYFVMPDRFANGDVGNDRGGTTDPDRLKTGFDPSDKGFYHGGDLAGLRSKLGYLDGLGVTAIWMTPMFTNRWVQGVGADVSAAYHGYWTTDYTSLDPHFGTTADMRAVITEAHRRGIKVFFDIVANHTADVIDHAEGRHEYLDTRAHPYLDPAGNAVDIKAIAGRPGFPVLSPPYTPVQVDPGAKKPLWLNDVALYHNRGDSTFTGESTEYGDFSGLDDLMTEHPRVVEGMERIFTSWIDTLDIDGYRVDTVKHVNMEFWQALAPHVKAYAARRGKPDFFVFGEVYSGDAEQTSAYTTTGRMQATLDFPFQDGALNLLAGRGSARLADVLLADDQYTDADSNAASLPTFLGNHDMGRLAWQLRLARPGIVDAELLRRLELGNALMYLWRGNPVVYYGDEQGFAGGGGDKLARQDMFASRTPEYAAERLVGAGRTGAQDNFNPGHPLYRQLRALASFVDQDRVWADGNQQLRLAEGNVLAFTRTTAREQREHLVVVNAGTEQTTVNVPVSGKRYRATLPAGDTRLESSAGKVRVTIPALSVVAFRGIDRLAATTPAPTLVVPARGTVLDRRVELRADGVTSYTQATFAARVEGAREWTVLGTDDAAPYRVFADVAALPGAGVGKRVEFRLVAKDSAGGLGADGASIRLAAAPPLPEPGPSPDWLVVHYNRSAGDYQGWGLHVWGDVEAPTEWAAPLPFAGETDYGRFAWVRLKPGAREVGFVVHRGDEKDGGDRLVDPATRAQVWLRQGQGTLYTSEIAASDHATVHFQAPSGDYSGYAVKVPGQAEVPLTGRDAFGATAQVAPGSEFRLVRNGSTVVSGAFPGAAAWVREGDARVHPSRAAAENRAVIHYHRPAGDYAGWTLYHWTGSQTPSPSWPESRPPDGTDGFGAWWSVPLAPGAGGLSHIIHRGDAKDPGSDQFLDVTGTGHEVWFVSGATRPDGSASYVLPPSTSPAEVDLAHPKAFWVAPDRLVWDVPASPADGHQLRYGDVTVTPTDVRGGKIIRLSPTGPLTGDLATAFPHLAGKPTFTARDRERLPEALAAHPIAVHLDSTGNLRHATTTAPT